MNHIHVQDSPESELQAHGYFIHHKEVESGPFLMVRLREMWACSEIDSSTRFKRSDWSYWADAEDLRMELEFVAPKEDPEPPSSSLPSTSSAMPSGFASRNMAAYIQQQKTIIKTYRGRESEATATFVKDAQEMAKLGYAPTSQHYAPGSYGAGSFIIAALLCFVCIGIIVFIYFLVVKPPGVLTVTYELKENQLPSLHQQPSPPSVPKVRYFLLQGSNVTGPHDISLLQALRSTGQITNETFACLEGSEEWVELAKVLP